MTPTEALDSISDSHGLTMLESFAKQGEVGMDDLAAIAYGIYLQALTLALRHPEYAAALVAGALPEAIPLVNNQADILTRRFPITGEAVTA